MSKRVRRTKVAPSLAIVLVELDNGAEEFQRLVKGLAALEEHANGAHGGNRVWVCLKSSFVRLHRLLRDAQEF